MVVSIFFYHGGHGDLHIENRGTDQKHDSINSVYSVITSDNFVVVSIFFYHGGHGDLHRDNRGTDQKHDSLNSVYSVITSDNSVVISNLFSPQRTQRFTRRARRDRSKTRFVKLRVLCDHL